MDHSTKYGSRKNWGPARMLSASLFAAAPWLLGIAGHLPTESQVVAGDAPLSQKGGGHGLLAVAGGFPAPVPQGGCFQRGGDTRVPPLCVVAEGSRGTPSKGFPWRLSSTGRGTFSPRGREWGAHPAGNRHLPCSRKKGNPPRGTSQKAAGLPRHLPAPRNGAPHRTPARGEPSTPPARGQQYVPR